MGATMTARTTVARRMRGARTLSSTASRWTSTAQHAEQDAYNAIVTRPPPSSSSSSASASSPTGPLRGTTLSIKHNFLTADMPATASSPMLAHFRPHFDATPVRLLRLAGCDVVGKTNCDEFGMGSANLHSPLYGPVRNPRGAGRERVSGGSSGGAAASVAGGGAELALASDTGGSVRLPASYCGTWGLKPSYGRVSRWGLIAYADSLDTVGLLTRQGREGVDLLERAWSVLDVVDGRDPTTVSRALRERAGRRVRARLDRLGGAGGQNRPLEGLVVGLPREYFPAELAPRVVRCVREVVRALRALGATVRSVGMPHTGRALGAYYVLASAEAASNLARYDGVRYGFRQDGEPDALADGEHLYAATRSRGFGAEVQKRLLVGTYALSADAFDNYFLKAQRVRRLVQADFDRVFAARNVLREERADDECAESGRVDILLHASAVGIAPRLSRAGMKDDDGAGSYVQDVLTVPASLAGVPALSMPLGSAGEDGEGEGEGERWPVGISAVAQWGGEALLLRVGRELAGAVHG